VATDAAGGLVSCQVFCDDGGFGLCGRSATIMCQDFRSRSCFDGDRNAAVCVCVCVCVCLCVVGNVGRMALTFIWNCRHG